MSDYTALLAEADNDELHVQQCGELDCPSMPSSKLVVRLAAALRECQKNSPRETEGRPMSDPAALLAEIRQAVADYMRSEGCSCCQDRDAHAQHEARLGRLLRVPQYKDGSGYDFAKYQSKEAS